MVRMSTDSSLPIQDSICRQPRYQPMVLCVIALAAGILLDRGSGLELSDLPVPR